MTYGAYSDNLLGVPATRNPVVTNGCLIVTAARSADLAALDMPRIRFKPRACPANGGYREKERAAALIVRRRAMRPLLLFHEQRHPVNHIRADTLITREHVSHGGLTPVQRCTLWVPIFCTRVVRYRPRSTCARKPREGWFLFIDPRQKLVAHAAYTGVTAVL